MLPSSYRCASLIVFLAGVPADTLVGQSLTFTPSSAHFSVTAEFGGEPMDPWESVITVADTTIEGRLLALISHRWIRAAMEATFDAAAIVDPASGTVLQVFGTNRGRRPNSFQLILSAGRVTGSDAIEGGSPVRVDVELPALAIPDFALGPMLAARSLVDGGTVDATVFSYGSEVRRYSFAAKVRSAMATREGAAQPESVWIVEGDATYAARVVIAKVDRQVLEVVIPQGTVGSQTETFTHALKR